MVTRTATNNATFAAAVTASVDGDIITCSSGSYGDYSSNKQFSGTLSVKSTDPLNPAIFSTIDLSNARGWTFEDIKIDQPYSAGVGDGSAAFGGNGSQRITITRCEVKNNNQPNSFTFGRGVAFFNASLITIQHCKVWRVRNGVTFSNCNLITVINTEVTDIGSDGMDFYSCSNVVCRYNFLHFWRPNFSAGDHCDGIQTASFVGEIVPINNNISDNIIDIENGAWIQAIFNRSEMFDATSNSIYRFSGFVIENNWIKNAFQYGIQVAVSSGVTTVRNNTIIWVEMNASDPYNAASFIAPPGENHDGIFSTQAIPLLYVQTTTGSGTLTGNRWYGGSYYTPSRLSLDTPQVTMISQGWTIADNVVDKDSSGPARPTFVTDFGGGGPPPVILPTVKTTAARVLLQSNRQFRRSLL